MGADLNKRPPERNNARTTNTVLMIMIFVVGVIIPILLLATRKKEAPISTQVGPGYSYEAAFKAGVKYGACWWELRQDKYVEGAYDCEIALDGLSRPSEVNLILE